MHAEATDSITFPSLGLDTLSNLGLHLLAFEDVSPEPKVYVVDIPGGDGVIDLTEALTGEVAYGRGKHTFTFGYVCELDMSTEETWDDLRYSKAKTQIKAALHGRRLDYQLSFDPGYTYTGRFKVLFEGDFHETYGLVKVEVEYDPYKLKESAAKFYDIHNGLVAYPVSGRKSVQPVFEFSDDTIVVFDGKRHVMPAGTYTINDVWFHEGTNELFMLPAAHKKYTVHRDLKAYTWEQLRTERRIYEIYWGDRKWFVSRIEVLGTSIPATGTLTFTATDEAGNEFVASLDIGDIEVVEGDSIVIEDGIARVTVGNGANMPPTVHTFAFQAPSSYEAPIVSLEADCPGTVTYNVGSNVLRDACMLARHSDHAGKTHSEMSEHRQSQLAVLYYFTAEVPDVGGESVYIQYEWREL